MDEWTDEWGPDGTCVSCEQRPARFSVEDEQTQATYHLCEECVANRRD